MTPGLTGTSGALTSGALTSGALGLTSGALTSGVLTSGAWISTSGALTSEDLNLAFILAGFTFFSGDLTSVSSRFGVFTSTSVSTSGFFNAAPVGIFASNSFISWAPIPAGGSCCCCCDGGSTWTSTAVATAGGGSKGGGGGGGEVGDFGLELGSLKSGSLMPNLGADFFGAAAAGSGAGVGSVEGGAGEAVSGAGGVFSTTTLSTPFSGFRFSSMGVGL